MSFRNRPALDRRHRPRWQDELRSQQLIVAGFAVAMAIAIGIFGATTWNTFYDTHLREVAQVGDRSYDKDDLSMRLGILSAELYSKYSDLHRAAGGANDTAIQQQLGIIQDTLNSIDSTAASSLTTGAFMRAAAQRLGISVSDAAITKEADRRRTLELQLQLSVITVNALPDSAAVGATPTDAQWAAAETTAKAYIAQIKAGKKFADLAKEKSADSTTAALNGLVGWVASGDPTYGPFFDAAKNGKVGDIIGPVKGDAGYAVLRVDAVRKAGPNTQLTSLLTSVHASDAEYRDYIHDELLRTAYQTYFGDKVLSTYMPQRDVAQIVIEPDTAGAPAANDRIRHILIQPIPGAQDQSTATDAQWAAALAKAKEVRAELVKPNASWTKLAAEFGSDGTKGYGGDLGWYNPDTASQQLDTDFVNALLKLKLNQISQPVKTQFGYHIVEIFENRTSAKAQADAVVAEVRKDPSTFAAVAARESSDHTTTDKGGDIGWVAPYEKDATLEKAIFALTTKGQISEPITGTDGNIYIFKLLDTSASRFMDADRLSSLKSSGYSRWQEGIKAQVGVWTAPELQSTQTGTTG
jgi:parvulin-like peptidyl-prolyl isomerase